MGRPKKYQSPAEKQRAYRQRKGREYRNVTALQYGENLNADSSRRFEIKRPPVRYYGGKWRIASWIIGYFPQHVTYCEPFCGAANVLFQKEPSKFEVINDLNDDVVNFFDVLRSRPDDLVSALELTPYSRSEHRRAHIREGDPVERARRFYVRSRQSFGSGEGTYSTGWRYQVNDRRGTSTIQEWNTLDYLWDAARRLKWVQIECDDALKVLQRFDTPQTLFYVDPPYVLSTRYNNSGDKGYAHEMTDAQHAALAEALHQVKGMVLLSGYYSNLYAHLYKDWHVVSKETRTNGGYPSVEYLWMNPAANHIETLPLFREVEAP